MSQAAGRLQSSLIPHRQEVDRLRRITRLGSRLVRHSEDADQARVRLEPHDGFRRLRPVARVDRRHVLPVRAQQVRNDQERQHGDPARTMSRVRRPGRLPGREPGQCRQQRGARRPRSEARGPASGTEAGCEAAVQPFKCFQTGAYAETKKRDRQHDEPARHHQARRAAIRPALRPAVRRRRPRARPPPSPPRDGTAPALASSPAIGIRFAKSNRNVNLPSISTTARPDQQDPERDPAVARAGSPGPHDRQRDRDQAQISVHFVIRDRSRPSSPCRGRGCRTLRERPASAAARGATTHTSGRPMKAPGPRRSIEQLLGRHPLHRRKQDSQPDERGGHPDRAQTLRQAGLRRGPIEPVKPTRPGRQDHVLKVPRERLTRHRQAAQDHAAPPPDSTTSIPVPRSRTARSPAR